MRFGTITCTPETPLLVVAATMAENQVHSVIVIGLELPDTPRRWGIVTDIDVLRAADRGILDTTTAGEIATTELVQVAPGEPLDHAIQIMAEHEISHLLVVDPGTDRPDGVLSTLDVAGVLSQDI